MAVILIVEDEVFILSIAQLIVEDLGHHTLLSSNVDEAMLLLRSPQRIDALFTDIRLKSAVHGGFELADEAVKLRPGLRVLYTSGGSLTPKMAELFVEGARFLEKPYAQTQLQNSVEEMLAVSF